MLYFRKRNRSPNPPINLNTANTSFKKPFFVVLCVLQTLDALKS
jgi:hypothetical protein